jgi:hypothetical protein
MSIQNTLSEIESRCYFVTETDVPVLMENGFANLPVLVRRSQGRNVVKLQNLAAYLARPMAEGDYLRDVSTWPEDIQAIKARVRPPHAAYS